MTKKRTLQILRGTTVQNDAYTGSAGELTMDTTTNELRLHDGSTTGGHIIGSGGSGSGYHPDIFSWQWADHQLDDVQWLRADTFSWQSGAVYESAYQHLADDLGIAQQFYAWTSTYVPIVYGTLSETPSVGDKVYIIYNGTVTDSGSTVSGVVSSSIITIGSYNFERTPAEDTIATVMPAPQTETITGTTITYYTAPDGHKIVLADQESNVAAIYAATGVAWYYILDTVNQRFKLPRTKFGVTGLRDTVGNYVEAGLPNITGSYTSTFIIAKRNNSQCIGAISSTVGNGGNFGSSGADSSWGYGFNFDASSSNSIYGNSSTVQPPATQMYLYFYVGSFTQTALENTAGLNAELFNDKVDVGHQVVAYQAPNAGNNYTWYRKYADGWVEQGGYVSTAFPEMTVVSLVVAMADTHYNVNAIAYYSTGNQDGVNVYIYNVTTSSIGISNKMYGGNKTINCYWQVSGVAA